MGLIINIECSEFPEGKLLCIHRRPYMENKNHSISSGTRFIVFHLIFFGCIFYWTFKCFLNFVLHKIPSFLKSKLNDKILFPKLIVRCFRRFIRRRFLLLNFLCHFFELFVPVFTKFPN